MNDWLEEFNKPIWSNIWNIHDILLLFPVQNMFQSRITLLMNSRDLGILCLWITHSVTDLYSQWCKKWCTQWTFWIFFLQLCYFFGFAHVFCCMFFCCCVFFAYILNGFCTVSQELTQPTPRILHVFTPGIFLCQPYTPEYAFRCIPSIGFLVGFGFYRLLNFSNRTHHCGREAWLAYF